MAIMLTKKAEDKVKEILSEQPESYAGLRIQVVGGGCSGFQYRMGFDKNFNDQSDQIFEFDGLKVFVDKQSLLYMDGAEVDYIEGLVEPFLIFNTPNVPVSWGVGISFSFYPFLPKGGKFLGWLSKLLNFNSRSLKKNLRNLGTRPKPPRLWLNSCLGGASMLR